MLTATFKELREAGACKPRYWKLYRIHRSVEIGMTDDTPISMRCIYKILGLHDTVWAIIHVCKRSDLLFNLLGDYYMYYLNIEPKTPWKNYAEFFNIISWIKRNSYRFDNFSIEELIEKILQFCDKEENG